MAVKKVALLDISGSESLKDVGYELRYLVTTDARKDGPLTVRNAVPWRGGDPYALGDELDQRATVQNISERQVSSSDFNNWIVSVQFGSPDVNGNNQGSDPANPLNDPVEVELSFEHNSRRTWIDGRGRVVANTAGELYPDGLEVEDNLPTLNFALNQAFFSESLAMQVRNSCNSVAWKGFAPLSVKLSTMKARSAYHPLIGGYYQCQYGFSFAANEIALRTISAGFNQVINRTNGVLTLARIELGKMLVSEPWPLDEDGRACTRQEQTVNGQRQVNFVPPPAEQLFVKNTPMDFNVIFGFL